MKYFRIVLVLLVTSLISAFCLSLVSSLAKARIENNEKTAIERAIYVVAPAAKKVEEKLTAGKTIYKLYDGQGNLIGYAFLAKGYGYQGEIKIICGLDKNLEKILGIEIIASSETPGLGAHINDSWFKKQFRGIKVLPRIVYSKRKSRQDNEIQAISGATISSRSVVEILNKEITKVRKILQP